MSSVGPRNRVVIVGGGLAGMSAAESLARHSSASMEVWLVESKQRIGGRAGSFTDAHSGQTVDYCQHVAMGCCTNLMGFLQRCELDSFWQRYRQLEFLSPDFPASQFAPSDWLPPPMHLASTIGSLKFLDRGQRRQVRSGLLRLLWTCDADLANQRAGQWLRDQGQDVETIRQFWDVILVSALGEQTEEVSMRAARKVLVDGFSAARGASDVLVPTIPLAEMFGVRMKECLQDLGVNFIHAAAREVRQREDSISAEVLVGDDWLEADHVVAAVPWHAVGRLLSKCDLPELDVWEQFPASPITGVHLWFDREITDRHHAVLVGTLSQWLFRNPCMTTDSQEGCYYQVVVSGSREARTMQREDLVQSIIEELRRVFPEAMKAKLLHSRVVTDPASVFSLSPSVEVARPASHTPLPWLHLAGDWIDTGWPATMEGAVISGRMAANGVLNQGQQAAVPIDPGLSRGWLARLLIV